MNADAPQDAVLDWQQTTDRLLVKARRGCRLGEAVVFILKERPLFVFRRLDNAAASSSSLPSL